MMITTMNTQQKKGRQAHLSQKTYFVQKREVEAYNVDVNHGETRSSIMEFGHVTFAILKIA